MKFRLSQFSELQIYRYKVLARCLLAIFAGFAIANLTVPMIALLFSGQLALATYTGLLVSFVVWLLYIVYVFSAKHLLCIASITLLVLSIQILIVVLLKTWGTT